MNKEWTGIVKTKLDSFNKRKSEISIALNGLKTELEAKYNTIRMKDDIADEEKLIWKINIGGQQFFISEEEIAKKQVIETIDEYNVLIDSGERRSVKETLQDMIIEKIRSF